jgi:UDP-N-acetylglucosamine 3-dehydrogenase
MKKLNVAVIGTGNMGKSHARVYSVLKNSNLVAVCDSDGKTSEDIGKEYGANHYTSYHEMLSKEEIDAVSICVPTKMHEKIALDVIRMGKHVLVEKPLATNVHEAQNMIEEAKKNNVKLMVGHIERFNPVVRELKKRMEKNELGGIYKIHCERLSPFPKRIVDVGVIIDLAIHEIDILNYLIKSKIKRLYAETAQRIHSVYEDLLIGTLRFQNKILGVISANWVTPKKVRKITITGEKGMFEANYLTQELFFYENEFVKSNGYDKSFMNITEGKKVKIEIEKKEPLKNELEAFTQSIVNDEQAPITGEEGMHALDIAQKFLESSKENKVISI